MPEEDLHLFDLTRLQAHDGRNKSGHDVERDVVRFERDTLYNAIRRPSSADQ
jgi:hypothetical protein